MKNEERCTTHGSRHTAHDSRLTDTDLPRVLRCSSCVVRPSSSVPARLNKSVLPEWSGGRSGGLRPASCVPRPASCVLRFLADIKQLITINYEIIKNSFYFHFTDIVSVTSWTTISEPVGKMELSFR